jgi:hypothetical protein
MTPAGDAIVVDQGNNRVRMLNAASDVITTLVGATTGSAAGFVDNVAGTSARLSAPSAVAIDALGQVFISDSGNARLRRLDTSGLVTTLAGNGTNTSVTADAAGPALAQGAVPQGLVVDAAGSIVFFDSAGQNLRRFVASGAGLPVCDGTWHHVALTHGEDTADTTKVYVDGALRLTQSWHLNVAADAALSVGFNGNLAVRTGERFAGKIDDLRIYPAALAAGDVSALFAAAPCRPAARAPPSPAAVAVPPSPAPPTSAASMSRFKSLFAGRWSSFFASACFVIVCSFMVS